MFDVCAYGIMVRQIEEVRRDSLMWRDRRLAPAGRPAGGCLMPCQLISRGPAARGEQQQAAGFNARGSAVHLRPPKMGLAKIYHAGSTKKSVRTSPSRSAV